MDFFKIKRFRKVHKPNLQETEDKPQPSPEEINIGNVDDKSAKSDPASEMEEEEDDDDDFITNEVKRRLKELRRNSFMVLIPEETCQDGEEEEDEEGDAAETSSSEWRSIEVDNNHQACVNFDGDYGKYCERMLFFDRLSVEQLKEADSRVPLNPSPRSASKKLASTLRSLSFKKREECQDDELLPPQLDDPFQDLENSYVAHICLVWEALHCQYLQLSQKILSDAEILTCNSHIAQQFQQFQVLLQRYIENEPFEQCPRVESYARTRKSFSKLLQVPSIKDFEKRCVEDEESGSAILASELMKIMENSILTFRVFLKMDKKKPGAVLNLFGGHNQIASPLQQTQSSLEKKEMKLKELLKKKKGWKKKSWPCSLEEVELLFGLVDIKLISRTMRMAKISKEQLLWCEEKLSKLSLSESKFKRDGTPVLFPC